MNFNQICALMTIPVALMALGFDTVIVVAAWCLAWVETAKWAVKAFVR
jgi:hypothetical protein